MDLRLRKRRRVLDVTFDDEIDDLEDSESEDVMCSQFVNDNVFHDKSCLDDDMLSEVSLFLFSDLSRVIIFAFFFYVVSYLIIHICFFFLDSSSGGSPVRNVNQILYRTCLRDVCFLSLFCPFVDLSNLFSFFQFKRIKALKRKMILPLLAKV